MTKDQGIETRAKDTVKLFCPRRLHPWLKLVQMLRCSSNTVGTIRKKLHVRHTVAQTIRINSYVSSRSKVYYHLLCYCKDIYTHIFICMATTISGCCQPVSAIRLSSASLTADANWMADKCAPKSLHDLPIIFSHYYAAKARMCLLPARLPRLVSSATLRIPPLTVPTGVFAFHGTTAFITLHDHGPLNNLI